ncbi:MAG: permease-like cell division protein FtsX [Bacteroidota bacterium]
MESKQRKKKKLGSYPYLSVVFSIFLSLVVIGLFGLLFIYANKLTTIIKENIEIQVYLKKGISDNQRIQVQKTLSSKDYVAKKNNELQIRYVSKEQAAEKFILDTGEDFSTFLGDNPLRDAYVVKMASESQSPEALEQAKNEIEKITGVFEVVYVESLVDSINKNLTKISIALLGFSGILILIVILLINNTIKLALFSQRFLIRSMQLVGAKASFIQRPFLMRSVWHGLFAGIFASSAVLVFLQFANREIEDLANLQSNSSLAILCALLLALGVMIGLGSTYRAIKKYMRLSLDELY